MAKFDNGTLRARFEFVDRPETTLLVRARSDATGKRVAAGYGLRICGRFAWLIEFRRGRMRMLGHKVLLKPGHGPIIEVLLTAMGPHLVADLYDAKDGQHLATVSTHEAQGSAGRIGLMAGCNRHKVASRLIGLWARAACEAIPNSDRSGPPLAVWLPADQLGDDMPSNVELERTGDGAEVAVIRLDAFGLEKLFCQGRSLLQVTSDLPWKYLDTDTLALRGKPPQTTDRGFRLDLSYKDPAMVEALLRGWQERYSAHTRLEQIGRSWQGRPIWALAVGKNLALADDRPAILLNGSHHGEEVLSTEFVLDAIAALLEDSPDVPELERLFEGIVFWCVPVVNPDGLSAFLDLSVRAGRKNGRDGDGDGIRSVDEGVDLNRNYPFRWGGNKSERQADSRHFTGPAAGSEPETRAMMSLADRERFVAALSYHMGTVALLAPYTIDGIQNPEPNEAWIVAEAVAAKMPSHPSGQAFTVRRKLYSVSGVDQDWHRHEHGTVALLLEGAGWPPTTKLKERADTIAAVRPSWMILAERFLSGPSLSGRVLDRAGRPLFAELRIKEVATREGERWMTRRRDGRFDRYLPRSGTYHLLILLKGLVVAEQVVEVGEGIRAPVEIKLEQAAGR